MKKTLRFRGQAILYYVYFLDCVTFILYFGEDVFVDSKGDKYFIHLEYHLDENKWVTEICFEDETVLIDDFINPDEYITCDEIEEIKRIARMEMDKW